MLGVKFEGSCRALKPILGLSGNGLQRAFCLLGPAERAAPVQRPHVTSILASGKRLDGLEIGKDKEDRRFPIKLFEKAQ